jgi:hypothetical protein
MNGWPRGGERPQCLQRPLDTCRDAVGPLAAGKLFPRSYLAGNGGTKQRPGSVPARKFSPALAPLTTLTPSARDIRRTRRSDSSASLRTVLRKSNPVEHSETSKHFWIGSNHTRRSAPERARHGLTRRSRHPVFASCRALSVVVVLVPVAFCVPPMLVFIPPPMSLTPAAFPHIVQFATLVICPLAVASVLLDRIVEFMFRMRYPTLTSVEVLCLKARHRGGKQNRQENGY